MSWVLEPSPMLLVVYPVIEGFVIRGTLYANFHQHHEVLWYPHGVSMFMVTYNHLHFLSDSFIITDNWSLQHLITQNSFPSYYQLWCFSLWPTASWSISFHSLVPILPSPEPPHSAVIIFLVIYWILSPSPTPPPGLVSARSPELPSHQKP